MGTNVTLCHGAYVMMCHGHSEALPRGVTLWNGVPGMDIMACHSCQCHGALGTSLIACDDVSIFLEAVEKQKG